MATTAATLAAFDAQIEKKKRRPTKYTVDFATVRAMIATLQDAA